jgi:hypothetical protein
MSKRDIVKRLREFHSDLADEAAENIVSLRRMLSHTQSQLEYTRQDEAKGCQDYEQLRAEIQRLRGQVHECPECGKLCRECRCMEAELERVRFDLESKTMCAQINLDKVLVLDAEMRRVREATQWLYDHLTDPHDQFDARQRYPWLEVSDE